MKDMLDEAKKISEPGSEPVHKMRRKSLFTKKDVKKDGVKKGKGVLLSLIKQFIFLSSLNTVKTVKFYDSFIFMKVMQDTL